MYKLNCNKNLTDWLTDWMVPRLINVHVSASYSQVLSVMELCKTPYSPQHKYKNTLPIRWRCTRSPCVHCMPRLSQYSRWDLLRDMGGVLQIWLNPHYFFIYVFIYIWSKMSALVQLINYQLFNLLLSLKLKSHILETNSHSRAIKSVLQVTSLSILTYAASSCLLDWECPTPFGQ